VNIITAAPKTDRYSADVSGLYGSYHHSDLQAALNAPIVNEKLAMRLSLNRTRENNFLEPYTDKLATKNDAARLKLLWKVTDDLNITLTGNYSKNGNRGEMSQQAKAFDKASSSSWTAAPNAVGSNNSIDQITKGGTATYPGTPLSAILQSYQVTAKLMVRDLRQAQYKVPLHQFKRLGIVSGTWSRKGRKRALPLQRILNCSNMLWAFHIIKANSIRLIPMTHPMKLNTPGISITQSKGDLWQYYLSAPVQ